MVMPSRNVLKIDIPDSYYHVYARGASRREIFLDDADYQFFLSLFSRSLSCEEKRDRTGRAYAHLASDMTLLTFCLMPNHFHILFYQQKEGSISTLMRGVMTSYSRYFNKKYDRSGPLFETRYKSSRVTSDDYLLHISRYIHLNHRDWRTWPFSSYPYFVGNTVAPEWLHTDKVLGLFPSRTHYLKFVANYQDEQRMRDEIKHQLANKE